MELIEAFACAHARTGEGVGCLYVVRHRHDATPFRAVHSHGVRAVAYPVRPNALHARGPVQADIAAAGLNTTECAYGGYRCAGASAH